MSLFANRFSVCQALVCMPNSAWVVVVVGVRVVCGWTLCVFVIFTSRQKPFRLSSCHVSQEPGSFPAQHITLQNYRERSWWKMRLILDGNYCSNPQAPMPPSFPLSVSTFIYSISLSIFFFCTCLAAPLFLPFLLLMASILHQSFLSAFYRSLFHNSSSLIYTSLLSFLIILNLYAPLFLPCILIALPPSTHFIIFTFALSHHILPVFVVPSCSPPAALVVLNARWLGAAGRMAAVLP